MYTFGVMKTYRTIEEGKLTQMYIKHCPHCGSRPEPVRLNDFWDCGVMFRDKNWRTKECYKREVVVLKDRIKMLETKP